MMVAILIFKHDGCHSQPHSSLHCKNSSCLAHDALITSHFAWGCLAQRLQQQNLHTGNLWNGVVTLVKLVAVLFVFFACGSSDQKLQQQSLSTRIDGCGDFGAVGLASLSVPGAVVIKDFNRREPTQIWIGVVTSVAVTLPLFA